MANKLRHGVRANEIKTSGAGVYFKGNLDGGCKWQRHFSYILTRIQHVR